MAVTTEVISTFIDAAGRGDADQVCTLLDQGVDTDTSAGDGRTALMAAAFAGHVSVVQALLRHGADPDQRAQLGAPALFWAVCGGHRDVIEALLSAGANPDLATDDGQTPLHRTASGIHPPRPRDIARALLEHGADVDPRTRAGVTPLMNAAVSGRRDVLQYLLSAGADPNGRSTRGESVLMFAARGYGGTPGVIADLLAAGARLDDPARTGRCVLAEAAANGHAMAIEELLDAGLAVDGDDGDETPPLTMAARAGHTAAVDVLLRYGANPNGRSTAHAPLLACLARHHDDIARILIEAGADPNVTHAGVTPLLLALGVNDDLEYDRSRPPRPTLDFIRFLLSAGADPEPVGLTPTTVGVGASQPQYADHRSDSGSGRAARVKPHRFAIIGGGTAGLSSAIFLARDGHRVTVLERFDQARPVGAGILIQPSGLGVLDELDVLDRLRDISARIDLLDGRTPRGVRVMNIRYDDLAPGLYGLGMHRGNLFDSLHEAALAAGVDVLRSHEAVSLQRASGRESVQVRSGAVLPGFDAVIIANGTQSDLRRFVAVRQRCTPYPWGALWSIQPQPEALGDDRLWQRFDGADIMIGLLPTGRSPVTGMACVSYFWSLRCRDLAAWMANDFDCWREETAARWSLTEPVLANAAREDFAFARYADVVMSQWHDGARVIIGDAGHGMSPQLGQGTNLALLDALTLRDCVRESADLPQAFARFSDRRRRNLRFYQFASRWLTPMFQSNSRALAWLRDRTFAPLQRIPWSYREALRTIAGIKTGLLFDRDVMDLASRSSLQPITVLRQPGQDR